MMPEICWIASGGHMSPHPLMILPFVALLLAIALMPFIHKHWWEHHYPKVAVGLGAITVLYYLLVLQNPVRLFHVGQEYVSFIALIGSLFVVAGGIHIRVKGESTPLINCIYLAVGAVLANIIGTTGASMLLIRPWIRSNKYRITTFHIVFFIFIVSNVGGCLTPIGDPPLFLGYLKKIPFLWTLEHLWEAWLIATVLLIGIFYVFDSRNFKRAPKPIVEKETSQETWKIEGWHNFIFVAVIIGAVFMESPWREIVMLIASIASYKSTHRDVHNANDFNFTPIKEVAWLFLGIFATMVAALDYLELHSLEMGINTPMKFYWITGSLSAVLDNAPTYLTFLTTSVSLHADPVSGAHLSVDNAKDIAYYLSAHPLELIAISLGAVFFGSMTYIGNGPNFMVKSIADQAKIHTPSFFGYVFKYSLPILIPVFLLISILYFSPWAILK
ncbi:MAG: sodium:proton antiporter [Verrucomicrobiota bacterium]